MILESKYSCCSNIKWELSNPRALINWPMYVCFGFNFRKLMILKENIATKDRVSHLCSKKVHNFGIFEVNKAIFISSVLLNTHSYTKILIK